MDNKKSISSQEPSLLSPSSEFEVESTYTDLDSYIQSALGRTKSLENLIG